MKRRRTTTAPSARRRQHKWWRWWPFAVGGLALFGLILVVGLTLHRAQGVVSVVPEAENSHGFVVDAVADWQRLLVIQSDEGGQTVRRISVISYRGTGHDFSYIRLPVELSDGATSANEYWQAGYYKELQQMVERQLGLPLTGYIFEYSGDEIKVGWVSVLAGEEPVSWWQSRVGLYWWLEDKPMIQSSLAWREYVQLVWQASAFWLADGEAYEPTGAMLVRQKEQVALSAAEVDGLIREAVGEASYQSSSQTFEIKNATNVVGLALLMGRYVNNLGGEVVATVAADASEDRSVLLTDRSTALTEEISRMLGIPVTIQPKTGRERSDVELVLGADVLNRLGW